MNSFIQLNKPLYYIRILVSCLVAYHITTHSGHVPYAGNCTTQTWSSLILWAKLNMWFYMRDPARSSQWQVCHKLRSSPKLSPKEAFAIFSQDLSQDKYPS